MQDLSPSPFAVEELFGKPASQQTLIDAARVYLAIRAGVEEEEANLKKSKELLDSCEVTLMQKMKEAKILSVKVERDGEKPVTLSLGKTDYYSAPAGSLDDREFHTWLLRAGGADLVKRTIHHATFSSFCRELAEAKKPLHPAVKVVEKKVVRVRSD